MYDKTYKRYIDSIKDFDPLTLKEEKFYFDKYVETGDFDYKNKILNANLKWVVKICKNYNYTQLPHMELITAGNEGMFKAFEMYNPNEYNCKFFTYATPWIKVKINNYIKEELKLICKDEIDIIREMYDDTTYNQDDIDDFDIEKYHSKLLNEIMFVLSNKEKEIINYLYGIGRTPITMVELSNKQGLSVERISQIKERAMLKMQHMVLENNIKNVL
jgi:RNA polymerase sigma factor (sigma-70 family)